MSWRIAEVYVERFLKKHGIRATDIEEGRPCWPTASGVVALKPVDVETMIAAEDPVVWAWLNLQERDSIVDPETKDVWVAKGSPWALFPIQGELARTRGSLIVECGAEVGKTRDIVLGTLWEVDCYPGGANNLIAADSDITIEEIWAEIEFQVGANPLIGGGVVDKSLKPFREMVFANGSRFQMRLCGHDGKQFRGGHFFPSIRADEVAKWKNKQQFSELWRAGKPGAIFRLYSTPDSDYSSPFFALCERAIPVGGKGGKGKKLDASEPRFLKFNITKMQLPFPFWSDARAAFYREAYGGEETPGYQANVLGKWGSPSTSVFPMDTLKPLLKYLPDYRFVYASVDKENRKVQFRASRLSPKFDEVDGDGTREEMLRRSEIPLISPEDLGREIASFFPSTADMVDPVIVCGADLGSAQDPSEFLFFRVVGKKWTDLFRLHLAYADWPTQAQIVAQLDHASGHRVLYGFDNGSAGSALVQVLTEMREFFKCPVCEKPVHFRERLSAFGFGEHVDEIDLDTGKPIANPDKKDKDGNEIPHRLSNKEFSTRILERKAYGRTLEIACDGGAGEQRLAASTLLVNHTQHGKNAKGERKFREDDDHHIDARRQGALKAVLGLRRPFVQLSAETVPTVGKRASWFEDTGGSVRDGFESLGSVRSGF